MKKIVGIVCAAIMALIVAGCASTNKAVGSSMNTSAAQQNKDADRPTWDGMSLKTSELMKTPEDKRAWGGYVDEEGLLFSGASEKFGNLNTTTSAAELNAKGQIAEHIQQAIARVAGQSTGTDGNNISSVGIDKTVSAVATKVSGIRRLDRYIGKDGSVYVLLFVSSKNIQDAAKDTSMDDYQRRLIETAFPVGASVAE